MSGLFHVPGLVLSVFLLNSIHCEASHSLGGQDLAHPFGKAVQRSEQRPGSLTIAAITQGRSGPLNTEPEEENVTGVVVDQVFGSSSAGIREVVDFSFGKSSSLVTWWPGTKPNDVSALTLVAESAPLEISPDLGELKTVTQLTNDRSSSSLGTEALTIGLLGMLGLVFRRERLR